MSHKTNKELAVGAMLCTVIILFSVSLFIWQPSWYLLFTYEDHIAEWAQVYFLLIGGFFLIRTAYVQYSCRAFFILLAIVCLYIAGEEISWGQRLFNLHVPDFFQQHNLQQETNLHNIFVGPYATTLKRSIEWILVIALLSAAAYAHPFSSKISFINKLKQYVAPPPPVTLISFFITAAFLELRFFKINEAEIAELLLTFSIALYALYWWRNTTKQHDISLTTMVGLLIAGLMCASLSMLALYQIPHMRTTMDTRMLAGKKTFASRYYNRNMLPQSTKLYLELYKLDAKQPWLLRSLAQNYRQLADQHNFNKFNQQAIDADLARYAAYPNSVALNLSLFESYAQSNQRHSAEKYLKKATIIANAKVKNFPQNADAFYWMGKVYQIVGKKGQAISMFRQAVTLAPSATLYRKELYKESQLTQH